MVIWWRPMRAGYLRCTDTSFAASAHAGRSTSAEMLLVARLTIWAIRQETPHPDTRS
jgi:hypothetical protein